MTLKQVSKNKTTRPLQNNASAYESRTILPVSPRVTIGPRMKSNTVLSLKQWKPRSNSLSVLASIRSLPPTNLAVSQNSGPLKPFVSSWFPLQAIQKGSTILQTPERVRALFPGRTESPKAGLMLGGCFRLVVWWFRRGSHLPSSHKNQVVQIPKPVSNFHKGAGPNVWSLNATSFLSPGASWRRCSHLAARRLITLAWLTIGMGQRRCGCPRLVACGNRIKNGNHVSAKVLTGVW